MNAVVVLPTYNEASTLARLLDALLANKTIAVLVVDDNSPDGTGDIARAYAKKSSRVHVLSGEKRGLGVAYRRGMQYALQTLHADVLIEMDADFSHNPKDIPRLLGELQNGADVAIGSRYVPGGKIIGWNLYRKLVSFGGNLVSRLLAGLYSVRDTTAGFRALRAEIVHSIDWKRFPAKGYAFQIALLHHATSCGANIVEVPVTFTDRELGKSKLGISDMLEFFVVALRLGLRTYERIIKFLLVGFTGLLVQVGLLSALVRFAHVPVWLSLALAVEASILWNFFFHDAWTFIDKRGQRKYVRAAKYHLASLGGIMVNVAAFGLLFVYAGLFLELANTLAIVCATAVNFSLSLLWAWKN